jgi:type III secretion protein R
MLKIRISSPLRDALGLEPARPPRRERRAERSRARVNRRRAERLARPPRRALPLEARPSMTTGAVAPSSAPSAPRRRPSTMRGRLSRALVFCLALFAGGVTATALPREAAAQTSGRGLQPSDLTLRGSIAGRPLVLVGALGILTLLPFVIIMVTSFVKISVVLSIVRSALGTQQIPPTQVITGLAIILTVYIMAPVGIEIYKKTEAIIQEQRPGSSLMSAETVDLIIEAMDEAKEPLRAFLAKNSHIKDRALFYTMAKRLRKPEDRSGVGPEDLMILTPAFVISELKESFQIGFIIFVPFLVIDLVVSNILMALGMQMLSPTTISLPFKLLLFVMIDGWYLLTKGLITGYL